MKNQPYNNNPPLLSSPGFGSFKLKQPQSLGAGCSSHGRHIVCSSISPPSTLATLSGYLTGISSFVSQNITASLGRPSGAPTAPENQALSPVNSNNVRDDKLGKAALISASQKEEVVFSKFQWIDWSASQSPRLFLLLGYWNGVQIWDVSDTETAVEIISIRDGWGAVTDINVIATPWSPQGSVGYIQGQPPAFCLCGADIQTQQRYA
ncbi:hypothetical protein BASA62_008622 [Batrachochytrium salamandrivorans]|nr:hypothetical protein BASA62_008622 [Batrachochytrium salamandrivorans]